MKELSPEQVARMRPEARERYEKRLKIVKRNRKILGIVCAVLGVLLVALVLSMTVLFNISAINVAGPGTTYGKDDVVMASGLNVGDNMVTTNFHKVEERIKKSLPYVKDAVITKTFSGKVTINISDTTAAIAVADTDGYIITDAQGKTLELQKTLPENHKLMLLKVKGEVNATVGEAFTFADEEEKKIYDELFSELTAVGLFKDITEMDITQQSSIKLIYQGRLRLLLGARDNLSEKIKGGAEAIGKENERNSELIAEINLTIPKKVFVNPLDSLDPPEEEPTTAVDVKTDGTDATEPTSGNQENTTQKQEETTENSTEATSENTNGESDD
ncbi:MAG: FtsQ-type POTRA domain-containing protein [Clostridia bacterium]|nr:FtsQ-type POTRA domain-containing protein [Clostridia bacterium]